MKAPAATRKRLGASADRMSVMAAACFTVIAVLLGVHTGYRTVDVDEVVFHKTVVAMRAGEGYYPAMSDVLTAKEGVGPSQIRSVRPPTLYLFLAQFPPGSWRYLVGLVYLATLLAWRLARALACFVPAGLAAVDRYRASASTRNVPLAAGERQ